MYEKGAIIRGDTAAKKLAIVFTGDEFADGANSILQTLQQEKIKASFFFTGRFYNNAAFASSIKKIKNNGHYLGAHSNDHLLYAPWHKRDSLLIDQKIFNDDLLKNYAAMKKYGIQKKDAGYFLPPYEWYNDSIAAWTKQLGLQLINYSPGTISHADYTWPELKNYRSSETILASIKNYEAKTAKGLNGFILLLHIGTDPKRTDKFYDQLPQLIQWLKLKGYQLERMDELLK
ncbi:MAG: polysaccharide deacetylase family protein [Chitinophagaceae bacterium]|nr:MAG: polysaccharide deacetylase family protein [Chitinophagaceae bacterium]